MLKKRTQEEQEADRATIARLAKVYRKLFGYPLLCLLIFAFFVIGYGKGYFDGYTGRPTIFERKESKHD